MCNVSTAVSQEMLLIFIICSRHSLRQNIRAWHSERLPEINAGHSEEYPRLQPPGGRRWSPDPVTDPKVNIWALAPVIDGCGGLAFDVHNEKTIIILVEPTGTKLRH